MFDKYIEKALKAGATHSKIIDCDKIVTGLWVRLKCQYGCGEYGKCLTCPPYSPTPDYTSKMLKDYSKALLIAFDVKPEAGNRLWRRIRDLTFELEREMFLDGYYKAFGMGAGPCHLCDKCDVKGYCKYPHEARPSMEACGIDVYRTMRNAGLKIEVAKSPNLACTYCGLVLIE